MEKARKTSKFPLSSLEVAGACTVVLGFGLGLLCVYLTMPESDYSFLKLPRTLKDLRILRYQIHLDVWSIFHYDLHLDFKIWALGLFWICRWNLNGNLGSHCCLLLQFAWVWAQYMSKWEIRRRAGGYNIEITEWRRSHFRCRYLCNKHIHIFKIWLMTWFLMGAFIIYMGLFSIVLDELVLVKPYLPGCWSAGVRCGFAPYVLCRTP